MRNVDHSGLWTRASPGPGRALRLCCTARTLALGGKWRVKWAATGPWRVRTASTATVDKLLLDEFVETWGEGAQSACLAEFCRGPGVPVADPPGGC